jgi:hypothetical protein
MTSSLNSHETIKSKPQKSKIKLWSITQYMQPPEHVNNHAIAEHFFNLHPKVFRECLSKVTNEWVMGFLNI